MITAIVAIIFKILDGANGFWLFAAMAADCYIAYVVGCVALGVTPHAPFGL